MWTILYTPSFGITSKNERFYADICTNINEYSYKIVCIKTIYKIAEVSSGAVLTHNLL